MARVQGRQQPDDNQAVMRPGENVPAGMLKLTLHDVELTTPGLCFCVLKIGPHWGRTSTLMASPKAAWDWEVTLLPPTPTPFDSLFHASSDQCIA